MSSKNVVDLRNKKPARSEQPALFISQPERPGKRVSPVRARRRRTRLILALIVLICLALVAFGVSWISYLPRYTVQSISVTGAQEVPSSMIQEYVESLLHVNGRPYLSKDNIFLYNPDALAREIVGYFPRIASAQLSRASLFSRAVTVSVAERQTYALWCTDDTQTDCYDMDHTGFIFAQVSPTTPAADSNAAISASSTDDIQASSSTATSSAETETDTNTANIVPASPASAQGFYVFEAGIATSTGSEGDASSTGSISPIGQTFAGDNMPDIIALLELLTQADFTPTGAIVQDDQDFWVPLSQGFYLKVSFDENPKDLVSNLQLVLSSDALNGKENQLEYVDLRFGDRVYYKLQGQDETQTSSQ